VNEVEIIREANGSLEGKRRIRMYKDNELITDVELGPRNESVEGVDGRAFYVVADEIKYEDENGKSNMKIIGNTKINFKDGTTYFIRDTIPNNKNSNLQDLSKEKREELEQLRRSAEEYRKEKESIRKEKEKYRKEREKYRQEAESYRKELEEQRKIYSKAREDYQDVMRKYEEDKKESIWPLDDKAKFQISGNHLSLDADSLKEAFSKLNFKLENFNDNMLHFEDAKRLNKESMEHLLESLESLKDMERFETLKDLKSFEGFEGLEGLKGLKSFEFENLSENHTSFSDHVASLGVIKQSLIADGLIKEGDKMRLKFNDKGMKVNGKKLNPTQLGKYLPMLRSLTNRQNNRFEYEYRE